MHRGTEVYARTNRAAAAPRAIEIAAFQSVIAGLETIAAADRLPPDRRPPTHDNDRITAFGRAHDLWSLLLRDLACDANPLPETLKSQLVGLGFWAMRYSTLAILKALPAEPLIDVCGNILAGLQDQCPPAAPLSTPGRQAANLQAPARPARPLHA